MEDIKEELSKKVYIISKDVDKNLTLVNELIVKLNSMLVKFYTSLYGIDFMEPKDKMIRLKKITSIAYGDDEKGTHIFYYVYFTFYMYTQNEYKVGTFTASEPCLGEAVNVDEAILLSLINCRDRIEEHIQTVTLLKQQEASEYVM